LDLREFCLSNHAHDSRQLLVTGERHVRWKSNFGEANPYLNFGC